MKVQCAHCSKSWSEDLSVTGRLEKSAPVPSSELAALSVQVLAQMDELMKKINGLLEPEESGSPHVPANSREI